MRISQNLERTEFLFMSFFGLISILFSLSLSFFFPSFLSLSGFVSLFIVFLSHSIMAGCFFFMRIDFIRISRLKFEKFKEYI